MKRILPLLKTHLSTILQVAFGLLCVGLGVYFIVHERAELRQVLGALKAADLSWMLSGLGLIIAFVGVQGMMYKLSFAAIHEQIRLSTGVSLYLKRNLVSVFLPAGLLTNMLFFNESVEKRENVGKTQIYFASAIFSLCSILSSVIIGLPALAWLLIKSSPSGELIWGVLLTLLGLGLVAYLVVDLVRKGPLYRLLARRLPGVAQLVNELSAQSFDPRRFWQVVGYSVVIELIGVLHLYIAVKALGGVPTWEMAFIGYAIVLLLLMSSPFLRGIGAIEVALTYSLTLFGLSTVLALSVAFLFRFFEFWAVLLLGVVSLVAQKDNLLVRILPSVLLFVLGLVNILSAVTPALPNRLAFLSNVIPLSAIDASSWMVLIMGLMMLAISVYLLRGLRNAWIAAVVVSGLSLLAHLTKGIDWEEASVALITLVSLLYQRQQYFIKPDLKLAKRSLIPGLVAVATVILFGTAGFYFLNPRHFNVDFSLWQSFQEAVSTFFLLNLDLEPLTPFGKQFLAGMNLLGGLTLVFAIYLGLRPLIERPGNTEVEERLRAMALADQYGTSSLDYFKTYTDKKFWFSPAPEGFVSFKTSRNYAIALGNPVCNTEEDLKQLIPAFDMYCRKQGLRSAYYRIPESEVTLYEQLGKKVLPIGEEAVVNLSTWTLEGSDKRGMRNIISKISKMAYTFEVREAPQKDDFLQQLRAVSEEWLKVSERTELAFSQGVFDEKELKTQTILTLENAEGKVVSFANLIPDYASQEARFDLMRKTADAPPSAMEFLFARMFSYLKEMGFTGCNMGMVPLSGIDDPDNLQERVIKLAYERMRQFGHYKSLRAFKEKFRPDWNMMYLAYNAPFDLIYLPGALERVMEP